MLDTSLRLQPCPRHVQGSLASRLASDIFDSNRLWFHTYKRAWRLGELRDTSVAVWSLTRVGWAAACVEYALLVGDRSIAARSIAADLSAVETGPGEVGSSHDAA